jgi:hypothetical protein
MSDRYRDVLNYAQDLVFLPHLRAGANRLSRTEGRRAIGMAVAALVLAFIVYRGMDLSIWFFLLGPYLWGSLSLLCIGMRDGLPLQGQSAWIGLQVARVLWAAALATVPIFASQLFFG